MGSGQAVRRPLQKVVDENFPVKAKRGGGIIKIEAWEDSCGEIVKYSMAYINQSIILFILMITGVFWDMTTHQQFPEELMILESKKI